MTVSFIVISDWGLEGSSNLPVGVRYARSDQFCVLLKWMWLKREREKKKNLFLGCRKPGLPFGDAEMGAFVKIYQNYRVRLNTENT